jgi:MobA/MobL family
MADYHLSVKAVSRAAGRSATAAAAYRAGCMIEDERTGTVHDYRRKQGVETAFIILPPVAPAGLHDRAALWNAAEAAEKRRDAKVAREWEVGLPRELSKEGRERAGREYTQWIVDRHGIAVDAALHAPSRRTDNDNWHMHLLGSTRIVGAQGFGAKTRELDRKQTAGPLIEEARAKWAEIANRALEREGHAARIDHRSLEARGIDRIPTIHEGPAVREMEARGVKTGIGDQNREIRADDGNKAEIALLETGIKTLDARIDRLTRLQATVRLPAGAVPKPAGTPPEAPEAERGAILAPETQPAPTATRAARKAVPDKIGRAQRAGRGGPMQYRGKPQAHTAGFRFPQWTPARAAKDPDSTQSPPPARDRKESGDGIPFVNKPYLGNVNTLAPTPVDIPEDPEERDKYFRAVHEIPHPGDLKDEQDRKKARKQQEQQEQAARRKAERQKGSGRAGKAARPPPKRGRLPPRSRFTRWLDKFREFVRKIGGKPTGSQIDSNLVMDEALRTQMAKNRDEAEKMAAQAKPRPQASRARAKPDPGPKIIAAQQKKPGRHSYSSLPKFTATARDSSATPQPESEESSKELIRQAKEADGQAGRQIDAGNREIDRARKEAAHQKWRLRLFKKVRPD